MSDLVLKSDIVTSAIIESGFQNYLPKLLEKVGTREQLYEKVFKYYEFLQKTFPENVNWDGYRFECTKFDDYSFALNYYRNGELSLPTDFFTKEEYEKVYDMIEGVSEQNPTDIVFPVFPISSRVPFLDVKKVRTIRFASNQ